MYLLLSAGMSDARRICLVGHSFISRLQVFTLGRTSANLDLPDFLSIFYMGQSGGKISDLPLFNETLFNIQPHIIILDIGGNDITDAATDVKFLAHKLWQWCLTIKGCFLPGTQPHIFILPQHFRSTVRSSSMGVGHYNFLVDAMNKELKLLADPVLLGITMWSMLGLNQSEWRAELQDGVHLNRRAMWIYIKNIQTIIAGTFPAL